MNARATKVMYIRTPASLHDEMQLLADREGTTLQRMGLAAIIHFLDMAHQQGRFEDDDQGPSQEEVQDVQAHCGQDVQ